MFGEGAPDEVVRVADPPRGLAREVEQEPGVVDAAAAERIAPRPDGEAGVAGDVGLEDRALDPPQPRVEPQVDEVRVEGEEDALGGVDLARVFLPEAGRRAEAVMDQPEDVPRLAQRQVGPSGRGDVENVVRARLPGVEIGLADRPGPERGVRPVAEIARVELAAGAVPVVGRTAEHAHPRLVEVVVRQADVRADVDVLGFRRQFQRAALHQGDVEALGREAARQRHAGRPRADHADVEASLEGGPVGAARVKEHRASARPDRPGSAPSRSR